MFFLRLLNKSIIRVEQPDIILEEESEDHQNINGDIDEAMTQSSSQDENLGKFS